MFLSGSYIWICLKESRSGDKSSMVYFTPNNEATLIASSISCFRVVCVGIINPKVFSAPIARVHKATVTDESIPPLKPTITPLACASLTRLTINLQILLTVISGFISSGCIIRTILLILQVTLNVNH